MKNASKNLKIGFWTMAFALLIGCETKNETLLSDLKSLSSQLQNSNFHRKSLLNHQIDRCQKKFGDTVFQKRREKNNEFFDSSRFFVSQIYNVDSFERAKTLFFGFKKLAVGRLPRLSTQDSLDWDLERLGEQEKKELIICRLFLIEKEVLDHYATICCLYE